MMDEKEIIETLDGFIENDQGAIKWSVISAIGLFVIGIGASGLTYLITPTSAELVKFISVIPGLAGTFVSSIPAKDYFAKKNRITSCKLFRLAYTSPPVAEKIDERFWKFFDNNLVPNGEKK